MNLYRKVLSVEDIRNLLARGMQLFGKGKLEAAVECAQTILSHRPDVAQAHLLLALVSLSKKNLDMARERFHAVTELQPNNVVAWAHLAKLFVDEGEFENALNALDKVVSAGTLDPIASDLTGKVYEALGNHEMAGKMFERAVDLKPNYVPFQLKLAANLVYRGRLKSAVELFCRILKVSPRDAFVHWSLSSSRVAKDIDHIDSMRDVLAKSDLSVQSRAMLHYAIGKELEDLECWDEAIIEFNKGAEAKRSIISYDEKDEIKMFKHLECAGLDREAPADREKFSCPIFIVGQPRSGSTLLDRILSSHSHVVSAGELRYFEYGLKRLGGSNGSLEYSLEMMKSVAGVSPIELSNIYTKLSSKVVDNAEFFIDKLPTNYLNIPFIVKALPDAKILHISRKPMDACFAVYKQLFADSYLYSYDQCEMARHFSRYSKLMDIYKDRFSDRIIDVNYEDLVVDVESEARRVFNKIGIPWESGCLEFHKNTSAVATASAAQVREPAHTRSIGRWKKYQQQLQPMLQTLRNENVEV